MSTLIRAARSGSITEEMREVARQEGVSPEKIRDRIASGRVIIVRNVAHENVKIRGIGQGLTTKVNVNVGTSSRVCNLDMEREKVRMAVKYGADTIMDLSTGGDLDHIRRELIREAEGTPFGTVPTYQVFIEAYRKHGSGLEFTVDDLFNIVERHLKDGVDFMTIHAGVTRDLAVRLAGSDRLIPIVSRGGEFIVAWMLHHERENPYYEHFDYLLELFAQYDATISLGDALRPGAIDDAHDEFQIGELLTVARLVKRARERGVQVMVEGPGHVPLNEIIWDVKLMKKVTKGAPYYVLGPLPTDVAAPYDHIAAAVGSALAAAAGADLLCYLTPAEHLSLPTPEQVKEGLIASKIAAHIADIVKLGRKVSWRDREISKLRSELKLKETTKYLLFPEDAEKILTQFGPVEEGPCTMCGHYCPILHFILVKRGLKTSDEKRDQ
ncbi:MAG: phosphomethylpyrimidine synthase ThiC [Crenarchaeota archaeon]|nr:phosphomethylpyrimidine synthase ThiC [Thermoproteota archaeon]